MSKEEAFDQVQHRFEWDAKNFDSIYRLESSPLSRAFNRVFRKAVFLRYDITFEQAGDVTGKAILDIGCGSGIYATDFARRGAARVLGVDFSGNMLELARAQAKEHKVEAVCEFRQQNFMEADFNEQFDVIIAMGVFDYLFDPEPFLCKMAKVSRGRVIASFPGHSLVREPARRLRYILTNRGDVHFYTEADVRKLADAAGFAKYEVIYKSASGGGFILVGDAK